MKLTEHTPGGIASRELTDQERQALADSGNQTARLEIATERYTAGTGLTLKVDLVAWAIGILQQEP